MVSMALANKAWSVTASVPTATSLRFRVAPAVTVVPRLAALVTLSVPAETVVRPV